MPITAHSSRTAAAGEHIVGADREADAAADVVDQVGRQAAPGGASRRRPGAAAPARPAAGPAVPANAASRRTPEASAGRLRVDQPVGHGVPVPVAGPSGAGDARAHLVGQPPFQLVDAGVDPAGPAQLGRGRLVVAPSPRRRRPGWPGLLRPAARRRRPLRASRSASHSVNHSGGSASARRRRPTAGATRPRACRGSCGSGRCSGTPVRPGRRRPGTACARCRGPGPTGRAARWRGRPRATDPTRTSTRAAWPTAASGASPSTWSALHRSGGSGLSGGCTGMDCEPIPVPRQAASHAARAPCLEGALVGRWRAGGCPCISIGFRVVGSGAERERRPPPDHHDPGRAPPAPAGQSGDPVRHPRRCPTTRRSGCTPPAGCVPRAGGRGRSAATAGRRGCAPTTTGSPRRSACSAPYVLGEQWSRSWPPYLVSARRDPARRERVDPPLLRLARRLPAEASGLVAIASLFALMGGAWVVRGFRPIGRELPGRCAAPARRTSGRWPRSAPCSPSSGCSGSSSRRCGGSGPTSCARRFARMQRRAAAGHGVRRRHASRSPRGRLVRRAPRHLRVAWPCGRSAPASSPCSVAAVRACPPAPRAQAGIAVVGDILKG